MFQPYLYVQIQGLDDMPAFLREKGLYFNDLVLLAQLDAGIDGVVEIFQFEE